MFDSTKKAEKIFALTDKGNGERLADLFGDFVRHVGRWNKWLVWNDCCWEIDEAGAVMRLAKKTVEQIPSEGGHSPERLDKWAGRSQSYNALRAMTELAKSEIPIPARDTQFDCHPWLFNAGNGTIDLTTGKMRAFAPTDYLTKQTVVEFDSQAECPVFEKFLTRVLDGDREMIDFLQKAVGYSLTAQTNERCLFILYGNGRNGKSTFLEICQHILGSYAVRTPTDSLMQKKTPGIPNDIARLRGARFVFTSETEDGQRINESLIKDLTGGDKIAARFLHSEFFEFTMTGKIWMGTNHKPKVKGTDEAIWDRLKLIPFEVRIPDEEIDPELGEKLKIESSGILRWAVEGCLKWQKDGLKTPEKINFAVTEYRSEMDVLGQFLDELCVIGAGCVAAKTEIYEKYKIWADENTSYVLGKIEFGRRLRERGFGETQKGHDNTRFWTGLGLKIHFETNPVDEEVPF